MFPAFLSRCVNKEGHFNEEHHHSYWKPNNIFVLVEVDDIKVVQQTKKNISL